jgi:antitoxin component YwqK of YwqJK toxin-antitoxin module
MTCLIYFNEPNGPFKFVCVHEICMIKWKYYGSSLTCNSCNSKLDLEKQFEYKIFNENGMLREHSYYKNGKLDGEYKDYHYNGKLSLHCYYKNGFFDGEYKSWWDGDYKKYYSSGTLYKHCYYKNGEIIKQIK